MIDAYLWNTPNGQKLGIALEEMGLPYTRHLVDIGAGEQHTPTYRAINPNGKIPAIVDHDGPDGRPIATFESGAILLYLAEKSGKFLAADPRERWITTEWLMFQMAGVGPTFGQAGFFRRAAEKVPVAIDRYTNESLRLLDVLDQRLAESTWLAGDYSVADIATFPWVAAASGYLSLPIPPNVARWSATIAERPAVQSGLALCRA